MAVGYAIESLDRSGVTGLITVNTAEFHPFRVGDKVRLYNVMGGGANPFMALNPYTVGSVTFTGGGTASARVHLSGGAISSNSMLTTISLSSGSQFANSTQYVQVVTSSPHNLTTQPRIRIGGVTGADAATRTLINSYYSSDDVQIVDASTLTIRLLRPLKSFAPGGNAIVWTTGTLEYVPTGAVIALDDGINAINGDIGGIGISTNQSRFYRLRNEGQIIAGVLSLAYNSKGIDYPFLRLFDPSDTSRLSKSALKARIQINTAATTLRSAMDTVIESYQGVDAKKRRYYINQDGQFVYELTDDTQPVYATAPYKIVVAAPGTPNATTVAASVNPYSLEIGWDHDTTKRALFTTSSRTGSPIADIVKADSPDALGTAYKRLGAPYFDEAIDYPTGTDDRLISRQQAAKSYFLERYAPILSGSFTLRGSGTASYNDLGFSSGYAQIASVGSASISPGAEIPYPASRTSGTVTASTYPFIHNFAPGMQVVVSGIEPSSYCGTFTIAGTPTNQSFTYASAGVNQGTATDPVYVAYGLYVRTGTAPNQIVTVTLPVMHGIATGATTVVTGLTGTAGTSMNGTATSTVISNYSFTYPSTGTNGTATGIGTVASITLVPRWEPGQWVDVTAAELGLSGIYRVEQVDWRLEPSSFDQVISITFNRRPSKTLTKLLKEKTG
jgi:hypothetical protein